ncbi:MAG: hypothetical protein OXG99_00625 [Alphaproteobacteria bacterium]|nr:hypothetical protein [Alphaproteobacteria bacterium]
MAFWATPNGSTSGPRSMPPRAASGGKAERRLGEARLRLMQRRRGVD